MARILSWYDCVQIAECSRTRVAEDCGNMSGPTDGSQGMGKVVVWTGVVTVAFLYWLYVRRPGGSASGQLVQPAPEYEESDDDAPNDDEMWRPPGRWPRRRQPPE